MRHPKIAAVAALLCSAACGGPDTPPPEAAPLPPVDSPASEASVSLEPKPAATEAREPPPVGDDTPDAQNPALEACQSAAALLDERAVAPALAKVDECYELMLQLPEDSEGPMAQAKQDIRMLVAELLQRIYKPGATAASTSPSTRSWDVELPMIDNEHVQRELKSFLGPERESFLAAYQRSGLFRPMILKKLEEAGLPSQLSWLPLVESLFKVSALSRASALGLWQFISSTGLRYGLRRDTWIDERLDPVKSTDAAIGYLMDLHQMFGDWPKALAAYNCGESRIQRLQASANGFMDFWDLYVRLPVETRRYVPRLIAAVQIIENPDKYGLTLPEPLPPFTDITTVASTRAIKLEALEQALKLGTGAIVALNPELRQRSTPATPYALKVPAGNAEQALTYLATLPAYEPPKIEFVVHRVRSGETLSAIAERYRTTITAIMQANGMRSANRIWPGQRLRIPSRL